MSEKPKNIKNDLLDALEILHLKKIAMTTWVFLKNPKMVVDSVAESKDEFVNPVKFLLAIGTPVIILLNILSPDVGKWEMSSLIVQHLTDPDPAARERVAITAQIYQPIVNKLTGELTPLLYLTFMPVMALITKWFYKAQKRPFYYYFSIAYYIGGVLCLFDLTTHLISFYVFQYHSYVDYIFVATEALMICYFYMKIFPGGLGEKTKSVSITLLCTVLYILLTGVVFFTVMLTKKPFGFSLSNGFRYEYIPPYVMGEFGTLLDGKNDSLVNKRGLKIKQGLLISFVIPGSPADKVGLKEGDIIAKIKNIPIQDNRDYRIALDSLKAGDSLTVLINRLGADMTLRVPVVPRISIMPVPKVLMGVLRKFLTSSININGFSHASKIIGIAPNSPAEKSGLKINDMIVQVDRDTRSEQIDWTAFTQITQKNPGDTTWLSIIRDSQFMRVSVIMAEAGKIH